MATAHYERAIALDPEYAEALCELGRTIGTASVRLPSTEARAAQEYARDLVVQAIEIDPTYARAYDYLSRFQFVRGDYIGATEMYDEYSKLARADVTAALGSSNVFAHAGRLRASLRIIELNWKNDPLSYFNAMLRAEQYIQVGRNEDAIAALADADRIAPPPEMGSALRRLFLAISIGEADGIREALRHYTVANPSVASLIKTITDEYDSAPTEVLAAMRLEFESNSELTGQSRIVIASIAAYYDDPEFALEVMSEELSVNMLRTNRL